MKNSEKFDIRYSKINLVFEFTEATKMPENKVSAIRGGMGEMLLEQYCPVSYTHLTLPTTSRV